VLVPTYSDISISHTRLSKHIRKIERTIDFNFEANYNSHNDFANYCTYYLYFGPNYKRISEMLVHIIYFGSILVQINYLPYC